MRLLFILSTLICSIVGMVASAAESAPLTIAVIPKGTTHEFWKAVEAGAHEAERELNAAGKPVKIVWKGPLREDDRASQIDVIQNFVAKGVSGIVLAPLDSKALVAPVEMAAAAGIPTVIIDSPLDSLAPVSVVATNNRTGGILAAQCLAKAAGAKGKALMLRYTVGSASTELREEGFMTGIKAYTEIKIVSQDQHAGATRESALTTAQNLLNRWGSDVNAVFTPNESSTAGMALALQEAGLAGKVVHVGFDASPTLIQALREGRIHGLVVQDPWRMGYLGVRTCAAHLRGEKVEAHVDTPLALVTKDNLDTPEIQGLIKGGKH